MARWPGYGVNIIQIELGPTGTLVGENEVSLKEAEAVVKVLDEAATHNVMVNILLSPHYFPGWAYAKWPNIGHGGGTSIKSNRRYSGSMEKLYTALNFSRLKLNFISERQLIAGKGRDYKLIVVPDATQLLPQATQALVRLHGARLAMAGDALAKDCYGRETPTDQLARLRDGAVLLNAGLPATQIQPALDRELVRLGALPEWRVEDTATGEPVWGVEWLPAKVKGRTVINAVNLMEHPVKVRILRGNRAFAMIDLLSRGGREPVQTLNTMTPVLAAPASP